MKKYLFVVAHPDDEVLGAGAFIYEAIHRGDKVGVAVLNTCDTTRYKGNPFQVVRDMEKSYAVLGGCENNVTLYQFAYIDSNFNSANHRNMVQDIESVIQDFRPDVIFTQHPGDINTDHYWAAASCMEAFRLWQRLRGYSRPIDALYLMEVQSSTDWALNPSEKRFEPNTFVEVSQDAVQAKVDALGVYENVVRPVPHPRSKEALMALPVLRGAQAGVPLAEAFECVFRRGL